MTSRLTIQELTEFVDYFDKLMAPDEPNLLPIKIAKQLLATMQREAKLRKALDEILKRASDVPYVYSPDLLAIISKALSCEYTNVEVNKD